MKMQDARNRQKISLSLPLLVTLFVTLFFCDTFFFLRPLVCHLLVDLHEVSWSFSGGNDLVAFTDLTYVNRS